MAVIMKQLWILFLLISISTFGQTTKAKKKTKTIETILFVCEHGAARSTIAAAYFNKLAKAQHFNYQATFRGTDPDTALTIGTKKGLTQDSFDVQNWKPLLVSKEDIEKAAQIVTFDCTLPSNISTSKPITQWNGIPAISKNYEIARDEILKKVQAFMQQLPQKKEKKKRTSLN
jgi:arsenate reductase (thioredoxin)